MEGIGLKPPQTPTRPMSGADLTIRNLEPTSKSQLEKGTYPHLNGNTRQGLMSPPPHWYLQDLAQMRQGPTIQLRAQMPKLSRAVVGRAGTSPLLRSLTGVTVLNQGGQTERSAEPETVHQVATARVQALGSASGA